MGGTRAMGGTIKAIENERVAVDDRTFRWSLKKRYPNMLVALRMTGMPRCCRRALPQSTRSNRSMSMQARITREEAMASETGNPPRGVSRRDLFRRAGAGAAVAVTGAPMVPDAAAQTAPRACAAAPQIEALETLSAAEADILEAICARLIPSDENGPGAAEARAAHYIDRALIGPLRASRDAYAAGLAAIDVYAQAKKGAPFIKLAPADQDAVLTDMESNVATGFTPNAATFFNLVRVHTIQGTFCDPYYGGNANFVGWDLIGFPGLRMAVTEDEQHMKAPKPIRKSAYEEAMFTMKGGAHGHRP
jgi:gluconate 2-dehydrogenase gamma chain